jgi:hypothetical protein
LNYFFGCKNYVSHKLQYTTQCQRAESHILLSKKRNLEESKKQNTEINNMMKRNPLRKQDLPLSTAMPASLSPYTTKTGGKEEGEKALELGKRIALQYRRVAA